ncbi:hypothetical protein ACHHYP_04982 [Achlya hypogyna]|uniref:Transmembrane protein n=1 Tax=Achlya hypogyna TaxID=1202772 RepID=A0A1V9Z011_ACHHY|nr:hypothetical protein ACHHYP_04982 [Achlya hypogyna]
MSIVRAAVDLYLVHRREKSKLKRFLGYLTLLSLTSFIFHPDGMVWVILLGAQHSAQVLLHHTVELCGYDTSSSMITACAASAWLVSLFCSLTFLLPKLFPTKQPLRAPDTRLSFGPIKGCKKAKRKEKKARAAAFSPRQRTLSPRHHAVHCYVDAPLKESPIPSPRSSSKCSSPRMPESSVTVMAYTPAHQPLSPPTQTIRTPTQISEVHYTSTPIQISEMSSTSAIDIVPEPEPLCLPAPLDEHTSKETTETNQRSSPGVHFPIETECASNASCLSTFDDLPILEEASNEVNTETCIPDVPETTCIEEKPETRPFTKPQLWVFLTDPKLTVPDIRRHVLNGDIDADVVLTTPTTEFVAAKVPQLVVRMLFITIMSLRDPVVSPPPAFSRSVSSPPPRVAPPPGFAAIDNNDPDDDLTYFPPRTRAASAETKKTSSLQDLNHQYERDMELISNQMTMNVLD